MDPLASLKIPVQIFIACSSNLFVCCCVKLGNTNTI